MQKRWSVFFQRTADSRGNPNWFGWWTQVKTVLPHFAAVFDICQNCFLSKLHQYPTYHEPRSTLLCKNTFSLLPKNVLSKKRWMRLTKFWGKMGGWVQNLERVDVEYPPHPPLELKNAGHFDLTSVVYWSTCWHDLFCLFRLKKKHKLKNFKQTKHNLQQINETTNAKTEASLKTCYTSRFVRVIIAQVPCKTWLYRSTFNGRSPKGNLVNFYTLA